MKHYHHRNQYIRGGTEKKRLKTEKNSWTNYTECVEGAKAQSK